ncbi:hypothetical protein [Streptomyces afghaniensis]|uniref:hypothetical protein n=1 Tax=Streptomyces afghaniensis TaxID=66865 RepID=UPI003F4B2E8B
MRVQEFARDSGGPQPPGFVGLVVGEGGRVGSPLVGDAADGGDLDQLRARAADFRKVIAGETP